MPERAVKDSFNSLVESEVLSILNRVSDFLTGQGVQAYVVGGLVRDVLLERDTADIDIAVATDALEIAPRVADALGGKYVPLDRVSRVGRIVLAGEEIPSPPVQWELDFSTYKGDIEQDLARRDFTINAMAIDISQLRRDFSNIQIIDPFNGWHDLHQGVIRIVSETAFESDAARLLRAVRLAAELGFSIDERTEALIRRGAHLVAGVAGERVREEMLQLMDVARSGQFLAYLDEVGLLTAVFPELDKAKGVEQLREHFWDVFEHSLKTVSAVDFLLRRGAWEYAGEEVLAVAPWSDVLAQYFDQEVSSGSTRRLLLKLAALLHDVSKPQTKVIEDGGRIRFLGHARDGAVIAADILERLRFSAREVKLVELMVGLTLTLYLVYKAPGSHIVEGEHSN